MREIDFLPEWYKSDKRRQAGYRTQYIVLGGLLMVIMVWNFVAGYSVARASAELVHLRLQRTKAEDISKEFTGIKNKVTELQKKTDVLAAIDSRINIAAVLAEISFLMDEKIVLGKVEFTSEKFAGIGGGESNSGSAVRVARFEPAGKETPLLGDVRFKVVISGQAPSGSEVANLVCRLEDSPYFSQVCPSFSQNRKAKAGAVAAEENSQASEFEISCYLANYSQAKAYSAKSTQNERMVK